MLNSPSQIPQTDDSKKTSHSEPLAKNQHGIHTQAPAQQQVSILLDVPLETLTGITCYLHPPALFALAQTCKHLAQHVSDDNTWRRAYVYQFLGVGPESDLSPDKTLLLRRSERTWRNEFVVRYRLGRRWERSRSVTTSHVPVHSVISSMHLMPSNALLTCSIPYGIVARSLPLTGKVLSGYLDASGTRAGLGIGNPNAEFTPNVSCCAMTSEGGTAKIVWESRAGDVLFMNAPRAMETTRRSAADVRRCDVADEHQGAVLDAIWLDNFVVTGGADGVVKLWDSKTVSKLWACQPVVKAFVPDAAVKVAFTTTYVVAVFSSGDVRVWTGFDLSQGIHQSTQEALVPNPIWTNAEGYDADASHGILGLYCDSYSQAPTILVCYENDPYFYRIRLTSTNISQAEITPFGDPNFGSTSIVVPYFHTNAESSFVLVGDNLGCVSLYPFHSPHPTASSNGTYSTAIRPIRKFEAHSDSTPITALAWSSLTLVTGSSSGTTHVFDGMTFRHLRSFASPLPRARGRMPAGLPVGAGADVVANALRERDKVRHILLGPGRGGDGEGMVKDGDRDVLFVAVGDRVLAWKAGPVPKTGSGGVRGRHKGGELGKKKKEGKYFDRTEMNRDISESKYLLLDDVLPSRVGRRAQPSNHDAHEQREKLQNLGLSEVEAVEYVLMLSRDEAAATAAARNHNREIEEGGASVEEGVFDYEDEEEEEEDDMRTTTGSLGSRRPSTSTWTSGSSVAETGSHGHSHSHSGSGTGSGTGSAVRSHSGSSSGGSNSSNATRGYSGTHAGRMPIRVAPSSSNDKIQISPPWRGEVLEAGEEYLEGEGGGGGGGGGGVGGSRMGLSDHYFPPISPPSRSVTSSPQASSVSSGGSKKKKKNVRAKAEVMAKDKDVDAAAAASSPSQSPSKSPSEVKTGGQTTTGKAKASAVLGRSKTSTSTSASISPTSVSSWSQRSSAATAAASGSPSPPRANAWASGPGPSRISPPWGTTRGVVGVGGSAVHLHRSPPRRPSAGVSSWGGGVGIGGRSGSGSGNPQALAADDDSNVDEDLKYALELSLAEAMSRGEN